MNVQNLANIQKYRLFLIMSPKLLRNAHRIFPAPEHAGDRSPRSPECPQHLVRSRDDATSRAALELAARAGHVRPNSAPRGRISELDPAPGPASRLDRAANLGRGRQAAGQCAPRATGQCAPRATSSGAGYARVKPRLQPGADAEALGVDLSWARQVP